MRLFGVLLVRDEVDVVRLCVLHHLAAGCERILAIDNGSSDGTTTVLRRLAARTPLSWTTDPGPYRQDVLVTGLVHEAAAAGADWVIPLDADEFWTAGRSLADVLAEQRTAAAVHVPRVNFVQRRERRSSSARGVLSMTMRVEALKMTSEGPELVRAGRLSVLELAPAPKLLLRASTDVFVRRGAHEAEGLAAPVASAPGVTILHAPLRSREALERKAIQGRRVEQAGYTEEQAWHVRHWAAQAQRGRLDAEWAAHSQARGALDVGERRVPLVHDDRLRRTLAPLVRPRRVQLAARLLRRTY